MQTDDQQGKSTARILGAAAFVGIVVIAAVAAAWYVAAGPEPSTENSTVANTTSGTENNGSANSAGETKDPEASNSATVTPVSTMAADSSPVPRGRTVERTFDDLKFEMETGGKFLSEMLTPPITDLFGQKIRIRGYILPTEFQDGIQQFVLVRDNLECCFGPGAALYDCILVEMAGDRTTSYTVRPVTVEGTFQSREIIGPNGKHLAIFGLTADDVK